MKIYVNELYEIVDVNSTENPDLKEYEISDEQFKGKCIGFIRGYKYEPVWKIAIDPETNLPKVDEEGNQVYELDEDGNKINAGWSLYPFWDYNQLCQMQLEYENKQLVLAMANMIGGVQND